MPHKESYLYVDCYITLTNDVIQTLLEVPVTWALLITCSNVSLHLNLFYLYLSVLRLSVRSTCLVF